LHIEAVDEQLPTARKHPPYDVIVTVKEAATGMAMPNLKTAPGVLRNSADRTFLVLARQAGARNKLRTH
jgi:hypothetical protein